MIIYKEICIVPIRKATVRREGAIHPCPFTAAATAAAVTRPRYFSTYTLAFIFQFINRPKFIRFPFARLVRVPY